MPRSLQSVLPAFHPHTSLPANWLIPAQPPHRLGVSISQEGVGRWVGGGWGGGGGREGREVGGWVGGWVRGKDSLT